MRPPAPVPETVARSMLFSFARRRTSGELWMRSPGRRGGAAGPAAGTGAGGAGAGFAADAAGADAGTAAALGWAAGEGASVFAGAGAGAAAAAPSESITPTIVWIGTVCPSPTLISLSTPAAGAGISASTLSVEISNSGSSRSTLSPGFFSHLVMVPSKMLSPIWGITISTAMIALLFSLKSLIPRQFLRGRKNFFRVGQEIFFQRGRIGHGRIERGHTHQRPIQILERLFKQDRGDFASNSAGLCVFVNHEAFVRLLDRIQNRLFIEGQQRAQIDHFRLDAFLRQRVRRFKRSVHHRRVR